MDDRSRWKQIAGASSRRQRLEERHRIIQAIRHDFDEQHFLEVETPLLVKGTCPDPYIDSVRTNDGYLITSTEYQIKRLIVGGFKRVFTLTKNFRLQDVGRNHSQEFTMLEWARADEKLQTIEEDAVRFIQKSFRALHPTRETLLFQRHEIDLSSPWEELTVKEAFEKHLGLKDLKDFSRDALATEARKAGISIPISFDSEKHLLISYLLDLLQVHLGTKRPTLLREWPSYLTSSAPLEANNNHIAERTELYIGGMEIANGFPFLQSSTLQRQLFAEALQTRMKEKKDHVTLDEHYLKSLDHLPAGAGMALGIDRLTMVLTDATHISDVQAFAWDEL